MGRTPVLRGKPEQTRPVGPESHCPAESGGSGPCVPPEHRLPGLLMAAKAEALALVLTGRAGHSCLTQSGDGEKAKHLSLFCRASGLCRRQPSSVGDALPRVCGSFMETDASPVGHQTEAFLPEQPLPRARGSWPGLQHPGPAPHGRVGGEWLWCSPGGPRP
ncbi:hypothetical protein P7K49_035260 [Saguinus oedipus]|uniref:Uncharacterized protein n=1 Tax=Saguinus oedipus TaxID=9490 RepID=A0ABQ9TM41_SAGOE|nr:hypothetical protein P7K49_035260 [Saguinus oedipus]